MKQSILILNWRDPKSPLEGGAERFTKKYAEYWAQSGHRVVWLTNTFDQTTFDYEAGVDYIRVGPKLTGSFANYLVNYPLFIIRAILRARSIIKSQNIDIVIDEIHGLPFFSPLYSKRRNILLVCEVAGSIWDKMFPFPINIIGKLMEKAIYQLYKHNEIWAISPHTRDNILQLIPGNQVKMLHIGIDGNFQQSKISSTPDRPSAIFLARLVKMKGIEAILTQVREIIKTLPNFELIVVGDGQEDYVNYLQRSVKDLIKSNNVKFVGHKDGQEKFDLLSSVDVLIQPSYKEGLGLTVIEAGIVGTPAIIRAGSGMDALIKDGRNGLVFTHDNEIAPTILKYFAQKAVDEMKKQAQKEAKKHTWDVILPKSAHTTGIVKMDTNTKSPLVSVVIPTYKPLRTLEKCLASIKAQTYKNIEIIVVDGIGYDSKDKLECKKIVKKYGKYIEDGPERSIQRNAGIHISKGIYTLVIDQDMYLTDSVIEELVAKYDDSTAGMLIPEISIGAGFWTKAVALDRYVSIYLETGPNECARFFMKSDAIKVGMYDPDIVGAEDADFHNKLSSLGNIKKIHSLIWHDEGTTDFWDRVKKKYYYASAFRKYTKKYPHTASKQFFPVKLAYFKHSGVLIKNPLVTMGMMLLRTAEVGAGIVGMLTAKK